MSAKWLMEKEDQILYLISCQNVSTRSEKVALVYGGSGKIIVLYC